ncbi:hypothetical protein ACJX0J_042133, partial [Zea mays]
MQVQQLMVGVTDVAKIPDAVDIVVGEGIYEIFFKVDKVEDNNEGGDKGQHDDPDEIVESNHFVLEDALNSTVSVGPDMPSNAGADGALLGSLHISTGGTDTDMFSYQANMKNVEMAHALSLLAQSDEQVLIDRLAKKNGILNFQMKKIKLTNLIEDLDKKAEEIRLFQRAKIYSLEDDSGTSIVDEEDYYKGLFGKPEFTSIELEESITNDITQKAVFCYRTIVSPSTHNSLPTHFHDVFLQNPDW